MNKNEEELKKEQAAKEQQEKPADEIKPEDADQVSGGTGGWNRVRNIP